MASQLPEARRRVPSQLPEALERVPEGSPESREGAQERDRESVPESSSSVAGPASNGFRRGSISRNRPNASPTAAALVAVRTDRMLKSRTFPARDVMALPIRPIRPSVCPQPRPMSAMCFAPSAAISPARASARAASAPLAASSVARRAAGTAFLAAHFRKARHHFANSRIQSRIPWSHGRGLRNQARIASKPGGVSSRVWSSTVSWVGSSERRLRIATRKRGYVVVTPTDVPFSAQNWL